MGVQIKKSDKSTLTSQVTELDLDSDDRFAEVKRNLSTNLQGRNPEKKATFESLGIGTIEVPVGSGDNSISSFP